MRTARLFWLFAVLALAMAPMVGAQQSITVEGTLVDSKCYLGMGQLENDHGNTQACGTMCLKMRLPAAVVTADNTFYTIIAPAAALASHAGHTMRVTGTLHNGSIMATKVEMNNNGNYTEVEITG